MHWAVLWDYRDALASSFLLTVQISLLSIFGSYIVGTIVGCIGALPGFFPKRIVAVYIEPLRNIPAVLKLFFLYFVLGLEPIPAGVLALTLHHSAYVADITAAGFRSIPREQMEAGLACGHSYGQVFAHILLPQGLRIIIPPMTSQFIDIVKNSAICMFIGLEELTWQTQEIASATFRGFEAATAITVLYFIVCLTVVTCMTAMQHLLTVRRRKT